MKLKRPRNRRAAFGAQKRAPKQQVAVAAAAKRETRGPVHRPGAAGCAIRPAARRGAKPAVQPAGKAAKTTRKDRCAVGSADCARKTREGATQRLYTQLYLRLVLLKLSQSKTCILVFTVRPLLIHFFTQHDAGENSCSG